MAKHKNKETISHKKKLVELVSKAKKKGLIGEHKILYEPPGVEKMSEVIIKFMKPYIDYIETDEALEKLVSLTILAWNISLLPNDNQNEMFDEITSSLPNPESKDMKNLIKEMIKRRKKYFANYTRSIIDYKISKTKDGLHLSVVSSLEIKEE